MTYQQIQFFRSHGQAVAFAQNLRAQHITCEVRDSVNGYVVGWWTA